MISLSMEAQPCLGTALGNDGEHDNYVVVTDVVEDPNLLDTKPVLRLAETPQPFDPALAGRLRPMPEMGLESLLDRRTPSRIEGEEVGLCIFGEADLVSHMAILWPDSLRIKVESSSWEPSLTACRVVSPY